MKVKTVQETPEGPNTVEMELNQDQLRFLVEVGLSVVLDTGTDKLLNSTTQNETS